MAIGDKFYGNPSGYIDESTGYFVIKPISEGQNRHMYFTSNPFTKDGSHIIFTSIKNGKENFYIADFTSGEYIQLTDREDISISLAYFDKERDTLYYGVGNAIFSISTKTLETKEIYNSDRAAGTLAVTCDGKYLISFDVAEKIMRNNDQQKLSIPLYRIFKIDLATKEETTIMLRNMRIDHIQCSPTELDLIMYCCWGYLATHHRIWYANLSGTQGGALGSEMPNEHRTHEYFSPDGKQVAFHAKFCQVDNDMNFFNNRHHYGIMDKNGGNERLYQCPKGLKAGHSIISFDGTMIAADGGENISLLELDDVEKVVRFHPVAAHNSSMKGNFVHPHPSFSNDDRYILFASDFGGRDSGNIYLVDLHSNAN